MFAEINKNAVKSLPFVIQTLGESTPQLPINRPDGFGFHHLIWVTEGSGSFTADGRTFTLEKGEGIFTRALIPHSYHGEDFSTMWLTFTMDSPMLDFIGIGDVLRFCTPDNMTNEARHLLNFANGKSNIVSRSAAGYSFITDFFMKVLSQSTSVSDRVLDILERRYSEPLSLDDIAHELCTDKYTLCRVYKSEKGVTVMDDLFRIRISKAKRFLKISSENISDIGLMCGFENSCYFIKRFREKVGCTPAQYRNNG
ncbi:MAG: helix-turn-helix transcriptional regulator [Clostridia bacterium]|nr:helix-turn-helix transcriptional regulator [Clostridia bacterium]